MQTRRPLIHETIWSSHLPSSMVNLSTRFPLNAWQDRFETIGTEEDSIRKWVEQHRGWYIELIGTRYRDLVLLIFNIAVKSEKLVVKGYIEFNFSFQSLSLSLFLPKYQLTKIDRLRIYIFIYFKKDSSGYIERFTELWLGTKKRLTRASWIISKRHLPSFKGISSPPYPYTSALCFIKKRAIYPRARGNRDERGKNVCLNFAFLCVAPSTSFLASSTL